MDAAAAPHPQMNAHGRLVDPEATPNERLYALWTHLSLMAGLVLVWVLPALVLWLIRRHDSPFLDDHGKEAVNFQVSLVLYFLISIPLCFIGIGFLIAGGVYVLGIVGMILAATAANRGEYYRYPMTLRFVK